MDKLLLFLKNWTIEYVKHRDIIAKNITKIDDSKDDVILVKFKDKKEKIYVIVPNLKSLKDMIKLLEKNADIVLLCFNKKDNLSLIINGWDKLCKYPKLCIYFVNPFSNLDKKWIIYPKTHNMVTELEVLDTGLWSLFSGVEEFNEKMIDEMPY